MILYKPSLHETGINLIRPPSPKLLSKPNFCNLERQDTSIILNPKIRSEVPETLTRQTLPPGMEITSGLFVVKVIPQLVAGKRVSGIQDVGPGIGDQDRHEWIDVVLQSTPCNLTQQSCTISLLPLIDCDGVKPDSALVASPGPWGGGMAT